MKKEMVIPQGHELKRRRCYYVFYIKLSPQISVHLVLCKYWTAKVHYDISQKSVCENYAAEGRKPGLYSQKCKG